MIVVYVEPDLTWRIAARCATAVLQCKHAVIIIGRDSERPQQVAIHGRLSLPTRGYVLGMPRLPALCFSHLAHARGT
jgi:hypothetical protein